MANLQLAAFIGTLLLLFILSIIDIKTFNLKKGYIPAFLTSAMLLLPLLLLKEQAIFPGILAGAFALILADAKIFLGIADYKAIAGAGMTMISLQSVALFILALIILSIPYKFALKKLTSLKSAPFLPAVFTAYLIVGGTLWL